MFKYLTISIKPVKRLSNIKIVLIYLELLLNLNPPKNNTIRPMVFVIINKMKITSD